MKITVKHLLGLTTLALSLSACNQTMPVHSEAAKHTPHWSYAGAEGPNKWGDLDATYQACKAGQQQSPINLTAATHQQLAAPVFHYQATNLRVLNNGHTVQVNCDEGSYLELNGQRYNVVQFHYHAPSEHTVDGKSYAAELHIVHKNTEGKLAVVGILLQAGQANPAYDSFISHLPKTETPETAVSAKIDVGALLPSNHTTYRYAGSLTTPPCTEGVTWIVMKTPVQLSTAQLAQLAAVHNHNNRPVQPLNQRTLMDDK